MKRKPHNNKAGLLIFILMAVLLINPTDCLGYSLNGLQLWFQKMIPTLFPFMVLSGIMVRMNLAEPFVKLFRPLLVPIFRIRPVCIYAMIIGFLCGFPMGAHTVALLYERKEITKSEATYLLAFCNNIGPVYFLSFVLPFLGYSPSGMLLIGMYGLPFLYGIFLRYAFFRQNIRDYREYPNIYQTQDIPSLSEALDEALWTALGNIAKLGGYMILFNMLFILPDILLKWIPSVAATNLLGMLGCLLEITGGIIELGSASPLYILCVLPFGGLSCLAQANSMIQGTDLSLSEYVMHKMILTAVTVFFYLFAFY